mmetsp:Transcript_9711/g.23921  ORF Transcript_9711/g.23921 Transcript_9711/m.23921 type:complete len:332 (+) Transcript_9711:638-1633(+)
MSSALVYFSFMKLFSVVSLSDSRLSRSSSCLFIASAVRSFSFCSASFCCALACRSPSCWASRSCSAEAPSESSCPPIFCAWSWFWRWISRNSFSKASRFFFSSSVIEITCFRTSIFARSILAPTAASNAAWRPTSSSIRLLIVSTRDPRSSICAKAFSVTCSTSVAMAVIDSSSLRFILDSFAVRVCISLSSAGWSDRITFASDPMPCFHPCSLVSAPFASCVTFLLNFVSMLDCEEDTDLMNSRIFRSKSASVCFRKARSSATRSRNSFERSSPISSILRRTSSRSLFMPGGGSLDELACRNCCRSDESIESTGAPSCLFSFPWNKLIRP